ncbi:DUF2164 domain-containing protein [Thermodesulfobacteriota bacterium]
MPERSIDNPAKINLTEDRRDGLLRSFIAFYKTEFDEELSQFRAEQIFDFFIKALGPAVYNQAVQDARAFMMEKLEDLDADFYFDDSNDV